MRTTRKLMVTALTLALAFAASVQAAGLGVDDGLLAGAADRAELQEITAVLADPDARERYAAVVALVNLASRLVVVPMEISDLLGAAARDSDPEIARFASNALYEIEMRARRLAEESPEIRPESEQREFEEIAAILNDPRSRERYRAAHSLTNLASTYDVLPSEVLDLLQRARDDDDFEIARLAETVLAQREGRPIDPAFRSEPAAPKDLPVAQKRGDNPFEKLSDPNPNLRYDALVYLLDIAPKDGRTIDPEVLKAFTEATFDPDPKVRSFAEFAIGGGLAGDENALRQVFVGTVQPVTGTAYDVQYDVQPPSPEEEATGAVMHEGTLDEHGVFIGVTKAPVLDEHGVSIGVTKTESAESLQQQPMPALDHTEAKQHRGALDEHGVFIGVVVSSIGAEQDPKAVTIESTSDEPSD